MSFTTTTHLIDLQRDVKLHVKRSFPTREPPIPAAEMTAVIFLHFWGGSISTCAQVNALVATTCPTIRIDFRGWGNSIGPDDEMEYSTIKLAQDVENIIRHLHLKSYIIVGHSMGAKVAQAVAGRKVNYGLVGLVLACPAPPTPLNLSHEMRDQQMHAYDNAQNAEFVTQRVLTSKQLPIDIVQSTVNDMLKASSHAKRAWPEYAMGENILDLAKSIQVPVLVIAAGKDVVEPVARVKAEVCANIPGARLITIDDSGHLIPLEAPEEMAEIIIGFLSNPE
ncbi:Alpha/Beta hydrolase protein [Ilyonectria robusta]|uniref:Alpha/Beta hydrolase protein n=1 Tax=Ilyonectria robusta TaxID=1079257 RepID=UPI001E8D0274|nr:Alpha/Beta hydrolase protein [Ilyonectria robusta]KAH8685082.1 Alpha/Beta hydrolase protein [Ilyonectria robusta]